MECLESFNNNPKESLRYFMAVEKSGIATVHRRPEAIKIVVFSGQLIGEEGKVWSQWIGGNCFLEYTWYTPHKFPSKGKTINANILPTHVRVRRRFEEETSAFDRKKMLFYQSIATASREKFNELDFELLPLSPIFWWI